MDEALVFDQVSKRWGALRAVEGLSFAARRGRILGFLGPNGAGKTTSLRITLGLVAPSAGRVVVLGEADPARVRARIGFLPEERGLYRRMTPIAAIAFLASLKGVPVREGRRRARALLEANDLAHAQDRQIRTLSKGMAQKVQLLSAIAHEPELIILDEPFVGLDPAAQHALEGLIRSLAAAGATVIFSTHVMQHAERLCDHVVLIGAGRKVFDGPVAQARAAAPRLLVLEGRFEAAALARSAGLEGAKSTPLEGGATRLEARLAAEARPEALLGAIFAAGAQVSRFELIEPTLHDAFIRLTSGAAPETAQAA